MKRNKHTLSHYRMVTANMGELFPVQCVPVLPGDTMQGSTSALIRVSPMNTPVMHPVNVRCHTFFVPNRIVFPEWEDFITGGNDGQGEGAAIPQYTTTDVSKKKVPNYMGVPPIAGISVNALPLLAFNKIYNEFYRDQDLAPERANQADNLPKIAWEKDYFTTARPWTQRGPDVNLPIGESAPVLLENNVAGTPVTAGYGTDQYHLDSSAALLGVGAVRAEPRSSLYADLTNASQISINDFRAGFALQRYQEARARYGARFTEYLRYLGITPSDARLQRPEFLGGGTTRLSFSEVLQTAPTSDRTPGGPGEDLGVGDLYGHGIAGLSTGKWRRFFEEHGYVITLMSIRPKSIYLNGIPREFLKTTKEDYFQKELANLGQQEIWNNEVSADSVNGALTFGYQDRYHEYRAHPSQVSNDFRDTLNAFHLARDIPAGQALNQSFIECDPSRRIFQVTDATVDTLWCMVNNHLVARRMVPKRANPRIL